MPAHKRNPTGSPVTDEPVFLAIGRLRSAHGIQGEITLEPWTDFPERIKKGSHLFLGDDHQEVIVSAIRSKDRYLILSLEGYDVRESVNELRNSVVYTKTAGLPALPKGQYYHHQLIGLQVVDENGVDLGSIKEILETGANDVFVIDNHGRELLVPLIKEVVLSVDLQAGLVTVKLQKWDKP
jgi:16S rRNA processing protein RimM